MAKKKTKAKTSQKKKFCSECGLEIDRKSKFCPGCGYKVIIQETVEDKEGHIRKAEQIIESESPIKIPEKLTLMPGEKLLERHLDFYVSNKRLIKHSSSLLGSKTEDYHYRHIKGMQDRVLKPFLAIGLIVGLISLFLGAVSPIFFLIGIVLIIIAFWYKKFEVKVMHMDGGTMVVPDIKSESGQKIAHVLRTRLYQD